MTAPAPLMPKPNINSSRRSTDLMKGRTSFVIAQRISTVRNADLIVLLDGGTIVATGTHDDLLRDSALYGEIVDSQLKRDEHT